jgi:hypothetical protein
MSTRAKLIALLNWSENSLREAAWAPLLVFGIHVMALRVFNTYERFPYLDLAMHFFGGVGMAFFFHRASINASLLSIIRPYHAVRHRLFVFTATCTVAVSWEFFLLNRRARDVGHTSKRAASPFLCSEQGSELNDSLLWVYGEREVALLDFVRRAQSWG